MYRLKYNSQGILQFHLRDLQNQDPSQKISIYTQTRYFCKQYFLGDIIEIPIVHPNETFKFRLSINEELLDSLQIELNLEEIFELMTRPMPLALKFQTKYIILDPNYISTSKHPNIHHLYMTPPLTQNLLPALLQEYALQDYQLLLVFTFNEQIYEIRPKDWTQPVSIKFFEPSQSYSGQSELQISLCLEDSEDRLLVYSKTKPFQAWKMFEHRELMFTVNYCEGFRNVNAGMLSLHILGIEYNNKVEDVSIVGRLGQEAWGWVETSNTYQNQKSSIFLQPVVDQSVNFEKFGYRHDPYGSFRTLDFEEKVTVLEWERGTFIQEWAGWYDNFIGKGGKGECCFYKVNNGFEELVLELRSKGEKMTEVKIDCGGVIDQVSIQYMFDSKGQYMGHVKYVCCLQEKQEFKGDGWLKDLSFTKRIKDMIHVSNYQNFPFEEKDIQKMNALQNKQRCNYIIQNPMKYHFHLKLHRLYNLHHILPWLGQEFYIKIRIGKSMVYHFPIQLKKVENAFVQKKLITQSQVFEETQAYANIYFQHEGQVYQVSMDQMWNKFSFVINSYLDHFILEIFSKDQVLAYQQCQLKDLEIPDQKNTCTFQLEVIKLWFFNLGHINSHMYVDFNYSLEPIQNLQEGCFYETSLYPPLTSENEYILEVEFDDDVSLNYERRLKDQTLILRNLEKIGEFQKYIKISIYKYLKTKEEIQAISEKNKIDAQIKNLIYEYLISQKDLNLVQDEYRLIQMDINDDLALQPYTFPLHFYFIQKNSKFLQNPVGTLQVSIDMTFIYKMIDENLLKYQNQLILRSKGQKYVYTILKEDPPTFQIQTHDFNQSLTVEIMSSEGKKLDQVILKIQNYQFLETRQTEIECFILQRKILLVCDYQIETIVKKPQMQPQKSSKKLITQNHSLHEQSHRIQKRNFVNQFYLNLNYFYWIVNLQIQQILQTLKNIQMIKCKEIKKQ